MSVRELSRRIEVSASHVSQVERGLASFSVPTLYRVAQELGISIDSLFEDPSKPKASVDFEEEQRAAAGEVSLEAAGVIQRVESRPKLDLTSGLTWERLTGRVETNAEFIEVVYEPSVHKSNPPSELVRHVGREYGIVISGELTIQVGLSISVLTEAIQSLLTAASHTVFGTRLTSSPCNLVYFRSGWSFDTSAASMKLATFTSLLVFA